MSDRSIECPCGVLLTADNLDAVVAAAQSHARDVHAMDLSDDEITKTHARYMVGGLANGLEHELLFRFEFPERPGALLRFLESLHPDWNITLFHYRYHGAHYGRVLAGIEAPPSDREQVTRALEALGYPFREVTREPSVELFMRGGHP